MINKLKLLFGSYSKTNIFTYIKWIALASILSTVGFYGYSHIKEFNDLKKTVAEQKQTIEKQEGTIKGLVGENTTKDAVINTLEESKRIAEAAAEQDRIAKETAEKAFQDIDKKRLEAERNARANKLTYKKQPKGDKSPPVVDDRNLETKLSDIRITSIHETYCEAVKNNNIQFCPSNLPAFK